MKYTSIFFENFLGGASSVFESSMSVFPTTTACAATSTIRRGCDQENSLYGAILTGIGSSVSSAIPTTNQLASHDVEIAQAYMESMDESELNEFIEKLESIEIVEQPKILQKTFNNNKYPKA